MQMCFLGNNQSAPMFMQRIRELFWENTPRSDVHRNNDMISSKWTEMKRRVGKFCTTHHRIKGSRRSGASDTDVYEQAVAEYNLENPAWNLHHAWVILKDHPRFGEVPVVNPKRSKKHTTDSPSSGAGSSDARYPIDLNEIEDEGDDDFVEALRPIGRDRAKAAARSRGQSSGQSSGQSTAQSHPDFKNQMEQFLEIKKQQVKARELEFYFSDISHLTGIALEHALRRKEEIAAKYFD